MRTRVLFIGDTQRGEQASNIRNLYLLFAKTIENHGVQTEVHVSPANETTGSEAWLPEWLRSLRGGVSSYVGSLDFTDAAVVAFELSSADRRYLNEHGVPWIDFSIHPIRFLEDLCFNVEASFDVEREPMEIPDDYIWMRARTMGSRCAHSRLSAGSRRLLLVGQTPIDKSVFFDGEFKTLLSYLSKLDSLSGQFSEIDYRPHPYLTDAATDATIRERYACGDCNGEDIYAILSSKQYDAVCAISSSLLHEAPYFGLQSLHLEPRALSFGQPMSYGALLQHCHLWLADLLQTHVKPRAYHMTPPVTGDYLRTLYCSWSYVSASMATTREIASLANRLTNIETYIVQSAELHQSASSVSEPAIQLNDRYTAADVARIVGSGARTLLEIECDDGAFLERMAPYFSSVTGAARVTPPDIIDVMSRETNVSFQPTDIRTGQPYGHFDMVVSLGFLQKLSAEERENVILKLDGMGENAYHRVHFDVSSEPDGNSLDPDQWLSLFRNINPGYRLEHVGSEEDGSSSSAFVIGKGTCCVASPEDDGNQTVE